MLRRRELVIGKSYVNDEMWLVREVVELGPRTVKYKTYHLSTGQLCGTTHECRKNRFVRWADREATQEEMQNLQHDETEALFVSMPSFAEWEPSLKVESAVLMMQNSIINR